MTLNLQERNDFNKSEYMSDFYHAVKMEISTVVLDSQHCPFSCNNSNEYSNNEGGNNNIFHFPHGGTLGFSFKKLRRESALICAL